MLQVVAEGLMQLCKRDPEATIALHVNLIQFQRWAPIMQETGFWNLVPELVFGLLFDVLRLSRCPLCGRYRVQFLSPKGLHNFRTI